MAKKKELREVKDFFNVLDSLGGKITGDYQKDLKRANKLGVTFSNALYEDAYQMNEQP
jgi:hypothetical protein